MTFPLILTLLPRYSSDERAFEMNALSTQVPTNKTNVILKNLFIYDKIEKLPV